MQTSVLSLPHSASSWDLVYEYYRIRRDIFIGQRGWALSGKDDIEFEQYDSVLPVHYIIGHEGPNVLGGARLVRCDTKTTDRNVEYSYMIRDAYLGRIDLPKDITFYSPPEGPDCWEITRLVVRESAKNAGLPILRAAYEFVASEGARQCLNLGSPVIMRLARRYGYRPCAIGRTHSFKGEKFLAFSVPISPTGPVRQPKVVYPKRSKRISITA